MYVNILLTYTLSHLLMGWGKGVPYMHWEIIGEKMLIEVRELARHLQP